MLKKRFDSSNYEANRPLPTGKNKKLIGLMKDDLEEKIMTEFAPLRPKTYSYLMDDYNSDKKAKETKKCVIKRIIEFNHDLYYLFNEKPTLQLQQWFKSEAHTEITKIALISNDDKRLQALDNIISYPSGVSVGKVCKTELLSKYKLLILMVVQMKIKQNIIQSGHIFQIIHTEY